MPIYFWNLLCRRSVDNALRTDHLNESCQIWLSSSGARCNWLERAKLVEVFRRHAEEAHAFPFSRDETGLLKLFNLHGGWFLDYRSSVVRTIHALSLARFGITGNQ